MSTKEVRVTLEVLCTWPADDVTIIQTINHPQRPKPIVNYIGLAVGEIDQLIIDLQRVKAEVEAQEQSYNDYCKAEYEHYYK